MNFSPGTRVQGSYFGVPFTGRISHSRPHSMNDLMVVFVDLDQEIVVFEDPRKAIATEVNLEGCGYAGNWMREAGHE